MKLNQREKIERIMRESRNEGKKVCHYKKNRLIELRNIAPLLERKE